MMSPKALAALTQFVGIVVLEVGEPALDAILRAVIGRFNPAIVKARLAVVLTELGEADRRADEKFGKRR